MDEFDTVRNALDSGDAAAHVALGRIEAELERVTQRGREAVALSRRRGEALSRLEAQASLSEELDECQQKRQSLERVILDLKAGVKERDRRIVALMAKANSR